MSPQGNPGSSERPRSSAAPDETSEPGLGSTLWNDLKEADFQESLQQDLQDVYDFYLDQDSRSRLGGMSRGARALHMTLWLVKSSILRLSPARRGLILVSAVLFCWGFAGSTAAHLSGYAVLALVLLLELKDKLLAQNELETGRTVQLALMPTDNPSFAGWETWLYTRPSRVVGGDLVDYLQIRDNKLGIAIGDVAGKGLGAALVMTRLQSMLRAIAPRKQSLPEFAATLNELLRRDEMPSHFVSLAYLELEANAGRVRLVNAGHMPPVVIRHGSVKVLDKGGPALGLLDKASYSVQFVDLLPGDLLLLYSDGLTEARNDKGTFFGDERLMRLVGTMDGLSANGAGKRMLAAYNAFVQRARPADDLSLVFLRRLQPEL